MRTSATVHPIDFSQLSGHDFERLVFAFLCRRWPWSQIDWFGQLGDDGGRDIWGLRENDWGREDLVVVACANWQRLTATKAVNDIDKIVERPHGVPNHLIVMSGGRVSAELKTKVSEHAKSVGIHRAEIWSGPEFEEQLRFHAESVLRRFFNGEALPDEPDALRSFVADTMSSDEEGLRLLARLFDRPAFFTHFHSESSLPAFRRAITDTIEALNTGIYRSRDGTVIGRVPSKNDFSDANVRRALDEIVRRLNSLRVMFDDGLRTRRIRPCGCGNDDCPTFTMDHAVARELDEARADLLDLARGIIPSLSVVPDFR